MTRMRQSQLENINEFLWCYKIKILIHVLKGIKREKSWNHCKTLQKSEKSGKIRNESFDFAVWVWKHKSDDECSLHKPLGIHFVRTPQGDKWMIITFDASKLYIFFTFALFIIIYTSELMNIHHDECVLFKLLVNPFLKLHNDVLCFRNKVITTANYPFQEIKVKQFKAVTQG